MTPPRMKTKGPEPWPHQVAALRDIHSRRGTLLWVPMGAGKSRIIVDYVQNAARGPVLILCPLKVVSVWPGEFAKYAVDEWSHHVHRLDSGTVADRAARLKTAYRNAAVGGFTYVAVLNYDVIHHQTMAAVLRSLKWDIVVLDECHRIKSPSGVTSRTAAKLCRPARKVIGLSGTPLSQGPFDIYGQARAIAPGHFGYRYAEFKARYGVWMTHPFPKLLRLQNMPEFEAKMAAFTFHVEDSVITLPEETDIRLACELPPAVAATYREFETELTADWEDDSISASNALVKALRLQQLAGGFFDPDDDGCPFLVHREKTQRVLDLLEDAEPADPFVIFCRFRAEIADLTTQITTNTGKPVYHLMGGQDTSPTWKQTPGGVLLVQISAGAEGVDFTHSRYCIYYSLCFSLKEYLQSRRRVNRPGQTRPVTYYHLVSSGTIDEDIYKALERKELTIDAIRRSVAQRRQRSATQRASR